jgi:hypothetical protein
MLGRSRTTDISRQRSFSLELYHTAASPIGYFSLVAVNSDVSPSTIVNPRPVSRVGCRKGLRATRKVFSPAGAPWRLAKD